MLSSLFSIGLGGKAHAGGGGGANGIGGKAGGSSVVGGSSRSAVGGGRGGARGRAHSAGSHGGHHSNRGGSGGAAGRGAGTAPGSSSAGSGIDGASSVVSSAGSGVAGSGAAGGAGGAHGTPNTGGGGRGGGGQGGQGPSQGSEQNPFVISDQSHFSEWIDSGSCSRSSGGGANARHHHHHPGNAADRGGASDGSHHAGSNGMMGSPWDHGASGGGAGSSSGGGAAHSSTGSGPGHHHHHLPGLQHGLSGFGGIEKKDSEYTRVLDEPIGEGTYGKVWKAVEKRTERIVAMKQVIMREAREGFPLQALREIRCLKQANHPNVVKLYDVCVGLPERDHWAEIYMVFEFMEHDLSQLLRHKNKRRMLDLDEAKCLAKQMFNGLFYIHEQKILHRDLKLSNMLLSSKGVLKIADFGLARYRKDLGDPESHDAAGCSSSDSLTSSLATHVPGLGQNVVNSASLSRGGGASNPAKKRKPGASDPTMKPYTNRVVTLWYRAPELLLGKTRYSIEIDMWSAGCILAELIVGRPLFPVENEAKALQEIFGRLGSVTPKGLYADNPSDHPLARANTSPLCQLVEHEVKTSSYKTKPSKLDAFFQPVVAANLPSSSVSAGGGAGVGAAAHHHHVRGPMHHHGGSSSGPVPSHHFGSASGAGSSSYAGASHAANMPASQRFPDMMNLVAGLLCYNCSARVTAMESYTHPFFKAELPRPCAPEQIRMDLAPKLQAAQLKRRKLNNTIK